MESGNKQVAMKQRDTENVMEVIHLDQDTLKKKTFFIQKDKYLLAYLEFTAIYTELNG